MSPDPKDAPETLNKEPTTRPEDVPAKHPDVQRVLRPVPRFLADEASKTKAAYIAAVASLVFAVVMMYLNTLAAKQDFRVFVLDSAGNIQVGPTVGHGRQSPLWRQMGQLGVISALNRNPRGFDYPDLVESMFHGDAQNKIKDDCRRQIAVMAPKGQRQKVEINHFEPFPIRPNGTRLLRVKGTLVRPGQMNGVPTYEADKFRMVMTLAPNPDAAQKTMFPYVVSEYTLAVGDTSWEGTKESPVGALPPGEE